MDECHFDGGRKRFLEELFDLNLEVIQLDQRTWFKSWVKWLELSPLLQMKFPSLGDLFAEIAPAKVKNLRHSTRKVKCHEGLLLESLQIRFSFEIDQQPMFGQCTCNLNFWLLSRRTVKIDHAAVRCGRRLPVPIPKLLNLFTLFRPFFHLY